MKLVEMIPLSYLSQYYYCTRRSALLMLEQAWAENEHTVQGRVGHENVHHEKIERRGNQIKIHELSIHSDEMSLTGKCDCVIAKTSDSGVEIPYGPGRYQLNIIEYKNGVVRMEPEYNVQLCAQAMCLEEMYGGFIEAGAIFYIGAHRQQEIFFTEELREQVTEGAIMLHKMLEEKQIPKAKYSVKCKKCSLLDYCLPRLKQNSKNYCDSVIKSACGEGEE